MCPTAAEACPAAAAAAQATPPWRKRRRLRGGIDLNGMGVIPVAPGSAAPLVGAANSATSPAWGHGLHSGSEPRGWAAAVQTRTMDLGGNGSGADCAAVQWSGKDAG
jgi:hypothetical protein